MLLLARGLWESRYNCCQSDLNVAGCCVADCHVTDTAPKSVLETYREASFRLVGLQLCCMVLLQISIASLLNLPLFVDTLTSEHVRNFPVA